MIGEQFALSKETTKTKPNLIMNFSSNHKHSQVITSSTLYMNTIVSFGIPSLSKNGITVLETISHFPDVSSSDIVPW